MSQAPSMPKWSKMDPFSVPSAAGVYVVYIDGKIVYIGSSGNLRSRLQAHAIRYGYSKSVHTPWGKVDGAEDYFVKVKTSRKYGDWAMLELRLIRRLQPRFNVRGVRRVA